MTSARSASPRWILDQPDAVAEFERAIRELGLKGLKLSPVYQAFDPRMDQAMRIYELADRFGVPVMFHIGAAYPARAALEFGSPVLLDPIARQFPRLKIIIAHLGQPNMADLSARFHRPWQLNNGLVLAKEYRSGTSCCSGLTLRTRRPPWRSSCFVVSTEWWRGRICLRSPTPWSTRSCSSAHPNCLAGRVGWRGGRQNRSAASPLPALRR